MTSRTECRLLIDEPRCGSWNMAVDDVLLAEAGDRQTMAVRFYQWSEPTLSLGYFQAIANRSQHPASLTAPAVRRSTGGGAILHDRELTYSITVHSKHRLVSDPVRLYRRVHRSLIDTLGELGAPASLCDAASEVATGTEPFLCFQRRGEGDVIAGSHKICGSAQRRHRGAILQHGSILLARSGVAPELAGIREAVGAELSAECLVAAWLPRLAADLDVSWRPYWLTPDETAAAQRVVDERYTTNGWLDRR